MLLLTVSVDHSDYPFVRLMLLFVRERLLLFLFLEGKNAQSTNKMNEVGIVVKIYHIL